MENGKLKIFIFPFVEKGPGCNDPQRRPVRPCGRKPISGMGRCTLVVPLSLPAVTRMIALAQRRGRSPRWVYPREPSSMARLPHRQKPYCEAPTGVADPITTWPSEVGASTQEGG